MSAFPGGDGYSTSPFRKKYIWKATAESAITIKDAPMAVPAASITNLKWSSKKRTHMKERLRSQE
jgi:hypothetical protein